jgi:hypothetical protein
MIISLFSVQKDQRPIYLKIALNYLIKNNFFVYEWCYVKQKKEDNKKQKGKIKFIWTLVLDFFQK